MADKKPVVLVAVDGSQESEDALNWYLEHGHRPGNEVLLAHCMEQPLVYGAPMGAAMSTTAYELVLQESKKEGEDIKKKYSAILRQHGVPGTYVSALSLAPAEWLVETAKAEQPTLLVMGSRGQGTLRRTVLGSVSDYVLHHAHCAVAIHSRLAHHD